MGVAMMQCSRRAVDRLWAPLRMASKYGPVPAVLVAPATWTKTERFRK